MGMSASQVNLGQLTARKNAIGRQLMFYSAQKVSLSNDMNKVTKKYKESLSATVLKWSNNQGVSYQDITYSNLMRPSAMNNYTPYLLTDSSGKVVVDSEYKDYAEKISPDGKPVDNWEDMRTEILSSITGLSADVIDQDMSNMLGVEEYEDLVADAKADYTKAKTSITKNTTPESLLKKLSDGTGATGATFSNSISSWAKAYTTSGATVSLGSDQTTAASSITSLINNLTSSIGKYFMNDDSTKLDTAANNAITYFTGIINSDTKPEENDANILYVKDNKYTLNASDFIDYLMTSYANQGATSTASSSSAYGDATQYTWYDVDSSKYDTYLSAKQTYEDAKATYDEFANNSTELLTADQENLIDYYDTIFSSIAEQGWTYNSNIEDSDYLNQMLQNNIYTITSVDRNAEYNSDDHDFDWTNDYETDIASNCSNIFAVNDSSIREQALADYEYEKGIINAKETRIDTRMQNLETEQSAITQMIQGIEQVRDDNIDRTFSIFG